MIFFCTKEKKENTTMIKRVTPFGQDNRDLSLKFPFLIKTIKLEFALGDLVRHRVDILN